MPAKRHNPFKLSAFHGVDPAQVERLAAQGIKSAEALLTAGRTPQQRAALAASAGIPEQAVLELVQLSDLARLPGVKGIRARLYYEAGVDSVEKLATWEPEALRIMVTEYVARTGFGGVPPLPKEVSSTVANAQRLPKAVEY